MVERQQDSLRLQPQMIAALRAEFRVAVDQISAALTALKREAYLPAPWLGDEVSDEVAAHYTARALDGPGSSYRSLLAYRDELTRVHDTLKRMEDEYHRTEGENSERSSHQA